ncbi:PREDICTED: uncharacterized protein LOC109205723 [Nicotiana attenuata]|uniref:uncharacterized protein LOC109205723 n=1 Tax=Nicotiana attenuata TaxID=49451 RepID=UPI00090546E4|nr:PREDICTED: uncharacterized protein LOC109205723 [Nicotiana attenuata]
MISAHTWVLLINDNNLKQLDDQLQCLAPQVGLDEEVKRRFREDLDEVVRGISVTEQLFTRGDFNGHTGTISGSCDDVHGSFDFGVRNDGGTSLLDFTETFDLVITNSSFQKKEDHLVTFQSTAAKIQIIYLLFRKHDRGLCSDCTVIPSENLTTYHWLLVMDLEIK